MSLAEMQAQLTQTLSPYEARLIIGHVLGVTPTQLLAMPPQKTQLLDKQIQAMLKLYQRRIQFEPMAYLLGYRDFYETRFLVGPNCLIPRADSECLIECARRLDFTPQRILDLCTGAGNLAISLRKLYPVATIEAIDIDTRAIERNMQHLGIPNIRTRQADIFAEDWINAMGYDLVLCNPPYLSHAEFQAAMQPPSPSAKPEEWPSSLAYEPERALYGGRDGLDFYRRLQECLPRLLSALGVCILEVDHKWAAVSELFSKSIWCVDMERDWQHLPRILQIRRADPLKTRLA